VSICVLPTVAAREWEGNGGKKKKKRGEEEVFSLIILVKKKEGEGGGSRRGETGSPFSVESRKMAAVGKK